MCKKRNEAGGQRSRLERRKEEQKRVLRSGGGELGRVAGLGLDRGLYLGARDQREHPLVFFPDRRTRSLTACFFAGFLLWALHRIWMCTGGGWR